MPWDGKEPATNEALRRFGAALRRARLEQGISQRQLEARCGIDQTTISRLENGIAPVRAIRWLALLLESIDAEPMWRGRDRGRLWPP